MHTNLEGMFIWKHRSGVGCETFVSCMVANLSHQATFKLKYNFYLIL